MQAFSAIKKNRLHYCRRFIKVEARRVELLSKHIPQKLSTCLSCFSLSGRDWKLATDHFLSCPESSGILGDHHSI